MDRFSLGNAVESVSNTFHHENTQSQLSPVRLPFPPHTGNLNSPCTRLRLPLSSLHRHMRQFFMHDFHSRCARCFSEKKIFLTVLNSISPSGPLHQMCTRGASRPPNQFILGDLSQRTRQDASLKCVFVILGRFWGHYT